MFTDLVWNVIVAILTIIVTAIAMRIWSWFSFKAEKEGWEKQRAEEKGAWEKQRAETRCQMKDLESKVWSIQPRDAVQYPDAVLSPDINSIRTLTQAEYDALTPDEDTLYIIR